MKEIDKSLPNSRHQALKELLAKSEVPQSSIQKWVEEFLARLSLRKGES